MKRTILFVIAALLFVIVAGAMRPDPEPKGFTIKLSDPQLGALWTVLEFSKQNLQTSEAKAGDVSKAITNIVALQELIQTQVKAHTDTTKKDSAGVKPKPKK